MAPVTFKSFIFNFIRADTNALERKFALFLCPRHFSYFKEKFFKQKKNNGTL